MRKYSLFIIIAFLTMSCASQVGQNDMILSDKRATPETLALYNNLKKLTEKGILFGHQDDLAYGVNWKYEPGRSDVKEVVGDYPAVYGWDLGGLEKKSDKDIDGVPFANITHYIKDAQKRGGITTLSWHMDNPLTGKNAWDTTPKSLASILPGGVSHEKYKSWLDEAIKYIKTLKDDSGKPIPLLYRPFHELTGDWFWWCKNNGSPEEFKTVWKFTVDYFKQNGIHNLIYVYNTSGVKTREEYLEYYPGTDYADILSFDNYEYKDPATDNSFVENCLNVFGIMDKICKEQNKFMAFAETGYEQIPYSKWWTETLINAMGDYKISYVLVWRNHGWNEYMNPPHMHYYAPYKGHPNEKDFMNFFNLDRILFEKDASKAQLYKK